MQGHNKQKHKGMKKRRRSNRVPYSKGMKKFLNFIPKQIPMKKRKRDNYSDKLESSMSKNMKFHCKICRETKTMGDAFYLSGDCYHAYCSDCVVLYIRYKLEHKIINIMCPVPGCRGWLEPEFCRSILPPDVFERWDKALCEDLFNAKEKFYCPFVDCSALLINDGKEAVGKFECPNCNRMICAQCKVRWHEGIECKEFKKLNRGDKGKDVMLTKFAKNMRWRQCPKCRFYVAKSKSGNIMNCRCHCTFCYKCGCVCSNGKWKLCNCYKRKLVYPTQPTFSSKDCIIWAQQLKDILESEFFTD